MTEILKQDQYQPAAGREADRRSSSRPPTASSTRSRSPTAGATRRSSTPASTRSHAALLKAIAEKKDLKGELGEKLKAALTEFAAVFQPAAKA